AVRRAPPRRLRPAGGGQAELGHLLPRGLVVAGRRRRALVRLGLIRRDETADLVDGRHLVEELPRRVAKDLLVLTESVIFGLCHAVSYFDFAMPSTRSPRML